MSTFQSSSSPAKSSINDFRLRHIVLSGGETGTDRAALDVTIAIGLIAIFRMDTNQEMDRRLSSISQI